MDIVEELREETVFITEAMRQRRLAADEIERMRADLSARKCVVTGCGMYDAGELAMAYERVKRLRTLLKMARDVVEYVGCSPEGYDDLCAMRDEILNKIDAALRGKRE